MRVIAGAWRSRVLEAPRGMATRPTSDKLRETLFNVLATRVAGAQVADLYAGSGAVGIEALSRGAAACLWVERERRALEALRKNLAALDITGNTKVVVHDAVSRALAQWTGGRMPPGNTPLDIVFLDPPYEADAEYAATLGALGMQGRGLLADGAVVIAEHSRKRPTAERYGALARMRLLEQGDAALSFYALDAAQEA